MEKKRFTEEEKAFLLIQVQKHKNIIENKETDSESLFTKKKKWLEISEVYNRVPGFNKRTPQQLQKCLDNIKTKRKREQRKLFEKEHKLESIDDEDDDGDVSNSRTPRYSTEGSDPLDFELTASSLSEVNKAQEIEFEARVGKLTSLSVAEDTINNLRIKEARLKLEIAKQQLEEARIKTETARLIQDYEVKYYTAKLGKSMMKTEHDSTM